MSNNSARCITQHIVQLVFVTGVYLAAASGFLSTRITESPLRNILLIYLSLLTGLDFFFPLPALGTSVHISLTFSITMLQCLKQTTCYNVCNKQQDLTICTTLISRHCSKSILSHYMLSGAEVVKLA